MVCEEAVFSSRPRLALLPRPQPSWRRSAIQAATPAPHGLKLENVKTSAFSTDERLNRWEEITRTTTSMSSALTTTQRRDSPCRTLEIRLQAHQVDRQGELRREATAEFLAGLRVKRVRPLRQREPDRRPPTLEPGAGTPHRRVLHAKDAHVQRLCRPGGEPVHRHGPESTY
jgi:hypothetical protein